MAHIDIQICRQACWLFCRDLWTSTIALPADHDFAYRYFIGTQNDLPNGKSVRLIRLFEAHLAARTFHTPVTNGQVHDVHPVPDTFGLLNDTVRVND